MYILAVGRAGCWWLEQQVMVLAFGLDWKSHGNRTELVLGEFLKICQKSFEGPCILELRPKIRGHAVIS